MDYTYSERRNWAPRRPLRIKFCFLTPPVSVGIVIPVSTKWLYPRGRAASKGYKQPCHFSISVISLGWQGKRTVVKGPIQCHNHRFAELGSESSQKEWGFIAICVYLPLLYVSESATSRRLHHPAHTPHPKKFRFLFLSVRNLN